MSEPQSERQVVGDYRLDVTDFGPIVKASVDLRPLTVFIGPSNTGKSYLAILIYALHKTLHRCFGSTGAIASSPQLYEYILDWAHRATSSEVLPKFPKLLNDLLRDRLELRPPQLLNNQFQSEVRRCFGLSESAEAVRHTTSANRAHIALSFGYEDEEQAVQYDIWLENAPSAPEPVSSEGRLSSRIDLHDVVRRKYEIKAEQDLSAPLIIFNLLGHVASALLAPTSQDVYYLPADRSGVMDIHQALASSLLQNAAMVGSRTPMLRGVLADFLGHLVWMPKESSSYHAQAERLERNILQGTIRTERSASDYPEFFYRSGKGKADLPLMRTSSMVSELAPVVLYLRYLVQPGDVLIIEEPESHLHPAMQAVFARELARLACSGIRVVVTTHSEWLLDQFANLVRLSGLPEDKRKEFPGADEALRPEQFGAWLFKPKQRPKGSVVEEIRVDPDAGGLLTDYNDIAEQLYNEWAEIGNRITESGK